MLAKSTSLDHPFNRAAVFFITAVAVLVFSRAASAQLGISQSTDDDAIFNILIPAPREDSRPLTVAKRALEEDNYNEAFRAAGTILGIDYDGGQRFGSADRDMEDFFVGPFDEPLVRKSLKLEAQRLIGHLSRRGRELFENKYGGDAAHLLEEAVSQRDMEKLADVSRLYFHTQAGYEAAFLMGKHHLDEGRPFAAALSLERLTSNPTARSRFDPQLSLLLATCWAYADMPDRASKVLLEFKQRQNYSTLDIGGQQVALFKAGEDPVDWLGKIVGSFEPISKRTPVEWAMFRGDAARNSQCKGGMPLPKFRWAVPLLGYPPKDLKAVEQICKRYEEKNWAVVPSLHPLAVDNWVLLRTPNELLGIDFVTGKRTWIYPWDESRVDSVSQSRQASNFSPRESQLNQRIFDDMPYGQMSSNGKSVYLIDGLGYVMQASNTQRILIQPGGQRQLNPNWPRSYNTLAALQLRDDQGKSVEGKLRWIVGGPTGEDEQKLAGAFFLGPPLPLFDELYALVEMDAEISLAVLDQETGQLRWRQQVASVESNNILGDTPRRLAGASPSFADGVLVCPTSSGAVVALDLSSRTLLWGFQFPRANLKRRFNGFGTTITKDERYVGNRWADSTVTIADGRVILTPVESDKAFCLDLLTGESQWSDGIDRDDMLFLACVSGGKAIFVGKSDIRAVQLKDGKQAWRTALGDGTMPSGQGYLSEDFYYLPTNDAQLLKIDAKTGKIAKRVPTEGVLGNLICYRGDVISLSPTQLAVFRQEAPLRAKVEAALKKNPNDPWALLRQGELYLLDEKFDRAIESIRRAHRLADQGDLDEARRLLADAMFAAIRNDFADNAGLAKELEGLLDSPEQLASYLRLTAQGKHDDGDILGAFQIYRRLIEMDSPAKPNGAVTPIASENSLRNVEIRRGRWLRTRLAGLLRDAGVAERKTLDNEIKNLFDRSVQDGSIQQLKRFVELFSTHPLAAEAKLLLSERFMETGDYLSAEQLLLPLVRSSEANVAGPATARLAQLLEKAGQSYAAIKYYGILARDFTNVVCLNGQTGSKLFELAKKSESLAAYRDSSRQWDNGRTEVQQSGENVISTSSSLRVYPIRFQQVTAASPEGLQVLFDQRSSAIVIRDGLGDTICRLPLKRDGLNFYTRNYAVTYARVYGHLLILNVGYDLLALDLFQATVNADEAILWRIDLTESVPPPSGSRRSIRRRVEAASFSTPFGRKFYRATDEEGNLIGNTAMLSRSGLCYLRHSELVCVDPVTGETLWSRARIEPGSELFGDEEVVFVIPKNKNKANAYSMFDGAPLATRNLSGYPNRWAKIGRRLLCWREQKDGFEVELYDPWQEKAVWSKRFTPNSRGAIIDGDELAMLQPNGELTLVSLTEGKVRFQTHLQPEQSLASIHVLRSSSQYLLVTNKNEIDYDEQRKIQPAPQGFHTPLVGGRVYALQRSTGEPMWQVPAEVDQYGLPLDQPREVPVLTFLRHATPTVRRGPRRTQTSILCLDRRDGRILLQRENIPAATYNYRVVGRPSEKTVRIQLPGRIFTLRFSDDPVAPEPPAQTGKASSLTIDDSELDLGRVANAIKNAFP